MKIRPLQDRIIVKKAEKEKKTEGGIILPEGQKDPTSQGEVVAVGPGRRNEKGVLLPMDVKVGDIIFFSQYAGTEAKVGGDTLFIMRQDEAIGVIE